MTDPILMEEMLVLLAMLFIRQKKNVILQVNLRTFDQHSLLFSLQIVAFILEAFFAEMELETPDGSEEDKVVY